MTHDCDIEGETLPQMYDSPWAKSRWHNTGMLSHMFILGPSVIEGVTVCFEECFNKGWDGQDNEFTLQLFR